jgi:alpha-tubulin suppressor-like RCC1 family protein
MDGTVRCWGYASIQRSNQNTQLAMSTTVPGLTDAVAVSAGEGYACVILGDQTAKCWGENTLDTLGNGQSYAALPSSSRPVEVVGLRGASSISAGRELTCAAMFDGTVRCWGFLPLAGSYDSYSAPIDIGLNGVADISAGTNHACARFSDGTVRCFGDVTYGSGYNRGYSPTSPTYAVLEPGSRPAVEVSAGAEHDCALGFDGSITCWGATESLGLGVDVTEEGVIRYRSGPGPVVGIANAKAMDAGNGVTCAIAADNSVWCWGIGLGHGVDSGLPQRIVGL